MARRTPAAEDRFEVVLKFSEGTGTYVARAPEIPLCASWGKTQEEVLRGVRGGHPLQAGHRPGLRRRSAGAHAGRGAAGRILRCTRAVHEERKPRTPLAPGTPDDTYFVYADMRAT